MSMTTKSDKPPVPFAKPPVCPACGLTVTWGQRFAQIVHGIFVETLHERCAHSLQQRNR